MITVWLSSTLFTKYNYFNIFIWKFVQKAIYLIIYNSVDCKNKNYCKIS